jgi:hypothetical protein
MKCNLSIVQSCYIGFTDPINVKFANTPNAAKSMIGLPLAPSYLSGIPTSQQPVLTTVPTMRQPLNRYRYAALSIHICFVLCLADIQLMFAIYDLPCIFNLEKLMNDRNIGKY